MGPNAKEQVLQHLADGRSVVRLPKAKAKIGQNVIHIRFTAKGKRGGPVWSFGINPNTITADYELWVCGSPGIYYLIPQATVREMYDDPKGYPDKAHKGIRVADVNTKTHECKYARNRQISLAPCFNAAL
jgi:hypothetical protein